jgi:PAS domain S-box-containing protein
MLRIGTKLALGTGTLLALSLVIGTVSYLQNSSVHDKLEEVTFVREPVNTAAHKLKKKVLEAGSATLGYFMAGDTALRAAIRKSRSEFVENRETFLDLLNNATDSVTASSFLERFMRFYALASDQIDLRDEQSGQMRELLENLDRIDGLLKNKIEASVRADDPIAYRRLQVALEMQIQMNAMVKGLGNYLLTGEERFQKRTAEARRNFSHFLQVYQVVLLSSEEKAWAAELIRRSDRSLAMVASITELQTQRFSQMVEFMTQYGELGSLIDDPLLRNTAMNLASAKKDLMEAGERANSTIIFVLLAGMAFGIWAAVVTTRKITFPLRHLVSVMNAVDHEGHAREIELRSSDEFRQVGESFNTMMRRLVRANEDLRNEIAERRKVEENLRESELRFRTIFEDAPIGVALTDAQGTILQANDTLKEILRCGTLGDIRGKTLDSVIQPGAVVEGARRDNPRRFHLEMTDVRADGKPSWISVNVSRIPTNAKEPQYSIVMMEDLTTQRELQQQLAEAERERLKGLRLFANSVQRAQEEERSRIARELHDGICQRLTGLKYHVEVLEEGIRATNRRAAKQLGGIRKELDRSVTEVRRISSNLRPSVLDDFGLVTALRILCKEFQNSHNILTKFRVDPAISGRVDVESETAIFRITQQALANVARHSHATNVSLALDIRDASLRLSIVDDGRGFTNSGEGTGNASRSGFGLVSMRERAELLGGHLFIKSDLEHGTTVSVSIPIREV